MSYTTNRNPMPYPSSTPPPPSGSHDTKSSITTRIITNILEWCSELQQTARDFTQLGTRDQAKVWNDLTGDEGRNRTFDPSGREYYEELYEPPEMVQRALEELEVELDRQVRKWNKKLKKNDDGTRDKCALDRVWESSPDYVNNVQFRIKFLRAEKFDARLAAHRMALHFEEKSKLFEEEALGREIQLSDLNEDDMACLNTGYLQVLDELDFGYRKVVFYYKALSDCYRYRENVLRSFWYLMNNLSQKEDVQKLGVVNVVYNICEYPKNGMDYEKSRRFSALIKAVPVRFCSFYPCIDTAAWGTVVETFSVIISKFLRIRLRIIKGDHEEVLLKLKSVGIPSECLPINENNELTTDAHLRWIAQQRLAEETIPSEPSNKRSRAEREDIVSNNQEALSSMMKMYRLEEQKSLEGLGAFFQTIG